MGMELEASIDVAARPNPGETPPLGEVPAGPQSAGPQSAGPQSARPQCVLGERFLAPPSEASADAADGPGPRSGPLAEVDLQEAKALGRLLKPWEQWRLYDELRDRARFLDIETLGLALDDPITLVGVSDGLYTSVLVSGRDLSARRLAAELSGARLLVTFCGTSFDLPRLRRAFPGLPWDLPHLDLAVAGRHVGLRGGLKSIERRLGWQRPGELAGLDGKEAIRLWRAHQAGDRRALPKLVRYCRADVGTLVGLAEVVSRRLAGRAPNDQSWLVPRPQTA